MVAILLMEGCLYCALLEHVGLCDFEGNMNNLVYIALEKLCLLSKALLLPMK